MAKRKVKVDDIEEKEPEPVVVEDEIDVPDKLTLAQEEFVKILNAYRKSNPEKYAAKKACGEFDKKLAALA